MTGGSDGTSPSDDDNLFAGSDWLVATGRGLFWGRPGGAWRGGGADSHSLNCLLRTGAGVVAGSDGGLWWVVPGERRWRQLHDELVTIVQAVALPGEQLLDLVAATGYGVHRPRMMEAGALRWANRSESFLSPNRRFSTALHALSAQRWLVGTEAGLLLADQDGSHWQETPVAGAAVRALLPDAGGTGMIWAGTDAGEIWRSEDGVDWTLHGRTPGHAAVLRLVAVDGRLVAGTSDGVLVDGPDAWRRTGPPFPVAAVAVDPTDPQLLVAGAAPGGLWWSRGADQWHQAADVPGTVRDLVPPLADGDIP